MRTMEDSGVLCPVTVYRCTSTQSRDWSGISSVTDERWDHCSWQHRHDRETLETVNLRRLIAEQNAMLNEQRRRIEATEKQIEVYERRIHEDRCESDGYDYLQRAYNLSTTDDDCANQKHRIVMEDKIAACYREATNDMRQRLSDVEIEFVDIRRKILSVDCDGEEHPRRADEFDRSACCDVDEEVQSVDDGGSCRQLRLELANTDDIHAQQMIEHRRLLSEVGDVQSQLNYEETRLQAKLLDNSPSPSDTSTDVRKLSQQLTRKTEVFQMAESQRHLEKQISRDCRMPACDATTSALSTPGDTRSNKSGKSRHDDKYITYKSHEIFTNNNILADSAGGSLSASYDLITDRRRLVTLV